MNKGILATYIFEKDNKISFNEELLIKQWKGDFKYKNNDELRKMVLKKFWKNLNESYKRRYYQPKVFNELMALQCGLTPFIYYDKGVEVKLLAVSRRSIIFLANRVLSPQLEAYQALINGTIDRNSYFFYNNENFKKIVDEKIVEKMNKKLNGGN